MVQLVLCQGVGRASRLALLSLFIKLPKYCCVRLSCESYVHCINLSPSPPSLATVPSRPCPSPHAVAGLGAGQSRGEAGQGGRGSFVN